MPKICYVEKTFSPAHQSVINQANAILNEYECQGFVLTLRQLYYQFVSRGLITNTQQSYNRLGEIVNAARLAGQIDWNHLIDRTRNVRSIANWDSPKDILAAVAAQYKEDPWLQQPLYVEVWIEKDAQVGNFEGVCDKWRLPLFSCRGYTSQSEMWAAAMRLRKIERARETLILHFGDHDPSGVDMTRDIQDRLHLFGSSVTVRRLALSIDQVREFNPPPNPAKITDSRASAYIAEYGGESWELDSMEPAYLADLVRTEIAQLLDHVAWRAALDKENERKTLLEKVSENWDTVASYVEETF